VAIDLDSIVVSKRRYDDEPAPPPAPSRHASNLEDIAERTGIPVKFLETLEEQNGPLILRGAELGFINPQGIFEALISAGD
jgi:hypothetical protein